MFELSLSEAERSAGALPAPRLAAAVRAIQDEGYAVLHGAVDLDHVDHLWRRMRDDYQSPAAREPGHSLLRNGRGNQPSPREPGDIFEMCCRAGSRLRSWPR